MTERSKMAISFQQQDAKCLAAMGDSHEYAQSAPRRKGPHEERGRDSLSDAIEVTGPMSMSLLVILLLGPEGGNASPQCPQAARPGPSIRVDLAGSRTLRAVTLNLPCVASRVARRWH